MKLSTKLNIVLLSVVLGLGFFLTFYVYWSVEGILEERIYRQLQNEAFHIMDKLDRFLFERHADIQTISSDPTLASNDINARQITLRLIEYRNRFKAYASLTFYDRNRVSIADTSGLAIGQPHSLTAYWPDIAAGQSYQGGHVAVSEPLEIPVIHFAEPVREARGGIVGYVVARIPLSKVYEITKTSARDISVPGRLFMELVDQNGLLIYSSSDRQAVLKKTAQQMGWFPDGVVFEKDGTALAMIKVAGKDHVFVYARQKGYLDFKGNNWMLVMHVSNEQILAPLISLRNKMAVMVFLIVVFTVVISLMFARSITGPLRR
ncbi:MAG: cache domain-containing protein, partial [Candidatus Omnitrophota bacterium]